MTHYYIGVGGNIYKGDKYSNLTNARCEAIKKIEAIAVKDPKNSHIAKGFEIYLGNTYVGTVNFHEFEHGKRKYYWQMKNWWYKLNKDGKRVMKAKDWHPFGL